MERLAETQKKHEPGAVAGTHARGASAESAPLHPLLQLQQQAGNQAVQQLLRSGVIQAKLAISHPDDPEEREADNIAHTIMRAPAGFPAHGPCSCAEGGEMCAECQQKQPQPAIHRHATSPSAPAQMPHSVSNVLHSPGHPLDAATRAFFEPRFGRDFSHVRVHTDPEAAASARSINALAYTAGTNIAFEAGHFNPASAEGAHLLAHELAHVVQQNNQPDHSHLHRFASKEHEELGDTTGVKKIDLGNGVVLSWGQVVALAGDYYESDKDLLADTSTPGGKDRIRAAMEAGGLPSVATTSLPVPAKAEKEAAESATENRYVLLLLQNIPHFLKGGTAKETWLDYHSRAIAAAIPAGLAKDISKISGAYFLEAFGQHFLTDSFSGGHIRTPRKDISDWYVLTFGPKVSAHFINFLRNRAIADIFAQVAPQVPGLARGHAHTRVENEVQTQLDAAIALIGGPAKLNHFFGLAIGGIVSGAVHDMEGNRGVRVNSKAHPAPWTAYGDDLLDDPRNKESRAEAVTAVRLSKADIDLAYNLAENESKAKDAAPLPTALPAAVFFKFDHSDILPAGRTALRGAAQYMIYHLEASVALEGHTDPIGKVEYNQNLGERRATAVANFLETEGIDKRRLSVSSAGETGLVTTNPREFWRDRRVTFNWIEVVTGPPHNVAFERARDAVRDKVGPPYKAEAHLPEPIDAANPAFPDWKWGSIPASFKAEIAAWVRGQLPPHVAGVLKSPQLNPRTISEWGMTITVEPRPVVEAIIKEILADPIAFLDSAFGVDAGP